MARRREARAVLIIEDEADIRRFACRVLELEGYHVLKADNGEEGLRLLRESRVSLVLLDLRLPGIDGWEVLAQMKGAAELSAIPIIVFSASADSLTLDKARSLGAADFLVKPVSASRLKETVSAIFHKER